MDELVVRLRSLRSSGAVLLPQIHRHAPALPEGGPYDCVIKLIQKHPDLCGKLVRKFGVEHPREVNIDKVDKAGADLLRMSANAALDCLAPLYGLLEEIAVFQEHGLRLLTDLHQTLLLFSFEYTPELLEDYMGLFVHLCKVHLLASKMPRPLILQVYAFAYDHIHSGNPPHFTEVCNFVIHFQDAIPRLQAEFQPISTRIGDILENTITPLLRCLSDFQQLRGSNIFSVYNAPGEMVIATALVQTRLAWATRRMPLSDVIPCGCPQSGVGGMTPERTFFTMQSLPMLWEWSILGLLVCPGETVRSELRSLLNLLLRDAFRYTVFRSHAEWLHPLFEKHVVPTMVAVAKKSHLSWGEKRDFKKLVERTFGEACEGAMQAHSTRRVWLGQQLAACHAHFSHCPGQLPSRLSMLLALLSLSRFEICWAIRHIGENLPKGLPLSWAKTSFSVSQPLKMGTPDLKLAVLISCHTSLSNLLKQYTTALRAHTAWSLWTLVTSTVKPMCDQVASAPTLTKHHEPVVQTIQKLVNGYQNISKAYIEKTCSKLPEAENTTSLVSEDLAALPSVQDIWYSLNAKLFSVKTNVTGQSLDSLTSRCARAPDASTSHSPSNELGLLAVGLGSGSDMSLVKHLNDTGALAALLSRMDLKLRSVSSLSFFCFEVPKLQALFTAALNSVPPCSQHCTFMLHVLGSFEENDCEKLSEDHGRVAHQLSEQFMGLLSARLGSLLQQLFSLWSRSQSFQISMRLPPQEPKTTSDVSIEAVSQEDTGLPYARIPPTSFSTSIKASVVRGSKDLVSSISMSESSSNASVLYGHFWQSEPAASCLASILSLVEACRCSAPPQSCISITNTMGMVTEEWLKESFYGSVRIFVRQVAWNGKIIQRPSAMESQLESFCSMLATIQPHMRMDLGMVVRGVLLTQSFTHLPTLPDGAVAHIKSTNNSVSQITDWLMNFIVRDRSNIGVAYSTRLKTFFTQTTANWQQQIKATASGPPLYANQYASLSELRAFVRVFGPYAALDLNGKLELYLRELVIQLNSVLKAHAQFLAGLLMEYPKGIDEYPLLQPQNIRALQSLFKHLGRCLFMRQLVSAACGHEMPNYASCSLSVYKATAAQTGLADPSRLFNLPPPGSVHCCCNSDPGVVNLLLGLQGEFENWGNLGVLMGLTCTLGDWVTAEWNPNWEVLSHDLHCIPHVMHILSASVSEASARTDIAMPFEIASDMFLHAVSLTASQADPKPSPTLLAEAIKCSQCSPASMMHHLAASCFRSSHVQGLSLC